MNKKIAAPINENDHQKPVNNSIKKPVKIPKVKLNILVGSQGLKYTCVIVPSLLSRLQLNKPLYRMALSNFCIGGFARLFRKRLTNPT